MSWYFASRVRVMLSRTGGQSQVAVRDSLLLWTAEGLVGTVEESPTRLRAQRKARNVRETPAPKPRKSESQGPSVNYSPVCRSVSRLAPRP